MRAAWAALLDANSSSGGGWDSGAAGGGAREIVDVMLADCHSRKTRDWDAECDRALYLEAVLEKVDSSSTSSRGSTTGVDPASLAGVQQQQQARLESAANEIAVVPAAQLPFSTFFQEYAVPRRPVVMLSEGRSCGGARDDDAPVSLPSREEQGGSSRDNGDPADHATDFAQMKDAQRGRDDDALLRAAVDACLPYPVHQTGSTTAVGTVGVPLRDCHEPLLENLLVPFHVSEDFAQRFRGQNVLPVEQHAEVERFLSGWHHIHRTRRGAYVPVSSCPAGANTLLAVMSGTLEVLVYAPADGLACLIPTFGNTPCSPAGAEDTTLVDKQRGSGSDVDDATINEKPSKTQSRPLGDETTAEESGGESNITPNPSTRGLLEEALGLGRANSGADDQSLPRSNFVDEMGDEDSTTGKSTDEGIQFDEGPQAIGATKSASKDIRVDISDPLERPYWPHEPRYCADVWQQDSDRRDDTVTRRDDTVTRKKVREMSTGDKLFVPSGGAVSWRAKGGGREDDEAIAVRFCYVDASNFNLVKDHLPLYAAVEAGASGLLQAFRSPVFDTSMSRNPSAVLAADFFAGDRHAAADSASSMSLSSSSIDTDLEADGTGAAAEGDDGRQRRRLSRIEEANSGSGSAFERSGSSSASLSSTSSGSGRKAGRRGRKSFKEWQDDSRWDLKVLGLTLPTLDKPKVTACERTACTVEWISSFVKQGQDQTKLGFNLSFVPAATTNASTSGGGVSRGGGFVEVYVGDSSLKSEHALDRYLLNLGITEGKRHTVVVDTNLVPDTPYRFSVCIIYGETAGPYSEFSKPARTTMVTAPLPVPSAPRGSPGAHAVTLHFPPPRDHGGSPVSWYHVMSRPTGENVLSKWQAVGMAPAPALRQNVSVHDKEPQSVAIKVQHLVPAVAYQFRVCAQNDIGTSPWSSASDPVTVLTAAEGDTIGKGFSLSGFHSGHQHFRLPNVTDVTVNYAGEMEPPPGEGFDPFEREVHGPAVVLDDRAGKVHVSSNSATSEDIDVWTCHFSPQSFRVKAEVVVAQPADALGELENGRFVRNRLVVVERGDIPIVHKVLTAQRAGALGVIVADDGRCGNNFGQLCVHGSDPPVGWAALDMPRPWLEVRVPVVLMLQEDADRLTAAAGAVAEEVESMAWSSLYDGWFDSTGSSSSAIG
eukprot:g4115.t1